MESQVSPKNIQERVEKMDAATEEVKQEEKVDEKVEQNEEKADVKTETKVEDKKEVKTEEKKDAKVDAKVDTKVEDKKEDEPKKRKPNDPDELRKWSTKLSQENASLRDDMKKLQAAIEKMSKKPIDVAALAKDPDALQKHINGERDEAVAEVQKKYDEARTELTKNVTVIERMRRESDKENFPKWEKLYPLIQTLAANQDGRVNFNQHPGDVLDSLYSLADQLTPREDVIVPVQKQTEQVAPENVAAAAKMVSEADMNARIAEAVAKAKSEAESGLRAEQNGGGIGNKGNGGRRDNKVSKEALKTMPLKDLKNLISE